MITHLEPDILECEVRWALGSTATNKASGGDGIPVELFQILKDDAVKVLHSICQHIWKTQQWKIGVLDLTEAEDIKKRWQENTEELYKKDLHDPDNHDDVITYLEPDILECEVKWALESITMNKASGGD